MSEAMSSWLCLVGINIVFGGAYALLLLLLEKTVFSTPRAKAHTKFARVDPGLAGTASRYVMAECSRFLADLASDVTTDLRTSVEKKGGHDE